MQLSTLTFQASHWLADLKGQSPVNSAFEEFALEFELHPNVPGKDKRQGRRPTQHLLPSAALLVLSPFKEASSCSKHIQGAAQGFKLCNNRYLDLFTCRKFGRSLPAPNLVTSVMNTQVTKQHRASTRKWSNVATACVIVLFWKRKTKNS